MTWGSVAANIAGVKYVPHVVITYNGTWGAGLVQYPGNVVNGLTQYINPDLCVEVPCPYPAAFGPIGGSITAPSYEQSVADAVAWTANWLAANPTQTFAVIGYSQGGEVASRVLIELQSGSLTQYMPNFIGGITFGNPCRKAGAAAPGIGNPGPNWRGISTVQITDLPQVHGQTVWADYFHNTTNGDAGNDMYAMVPTGQVGTVMSDVYTTAIQAQLNDFSAFIGAMVQDLLKTVQDSGVLSGLTGGIPGLLGMGTGAALAFLVDLVGGGNPQATGVNADVEAAVLGLKFLAAPGGGTAPHVSYLGEIPGYSKLVAGAVGFLNHIATLTPAHA